MTVARAIFNLKRSVQNSLSKIVFKNHRRNKLVISPINEKTYYYENDILKFDLKGHGVDYINLQNSFIVADFDFAKDPTNWDNTRPDTVVFNKGTLSLFKRNRLLFGSKELSNVDNFGLINWMLYHGSMNRLQRNETIMYGFTHDTIEPVRLDKEHFPYRAQVPFFTPLDVGREIPIYQIADRLTLEFTLTEAWKLFTFETVEDNEDEANLKYRISNVRLYIDARTAVSGGILEGTEFTFHSWDWRSFESVLEPTTHNWTISYDIKHSSVKKFLGKFEYQGTTGTAFSKVNKSTCPGFAYTYFSMGGQYMPYPYPITDQFLLYQELLSFFHLSFNMGYTQDFPIEWMPLTVTNKRSFQEYWWWLAAVFDRLPQNNNVISGISTERFDVQLHLRTNQVDLLDKLNYFYGFFCYDIIVHIRGGIVEIED